MKTNTGARKLVRFCDSDYGHDKLEFSGSSAWVTSDVNLQTADIIYRNSVKIHSIIIEKF